MLNFFRKNLDIAKADIQLDVNDKTVLITTRCCEFPDANAPLKLGQNNHKKIVPIIANVSDVLVDPSFPLPFSNFS